MYIYHLMISYRLVCLASRRHWDQVLQRRLLVVARRGRWQPVWQVCSQGWSCPRPTSSRPKAVNRPTRAAKVHKRAENEMASSDLEQRLEEKPGNEKAAAYLEFEDFSHTGLGLETYEDGLQHPIELRRILTGDLRCLSEQFRTWFLKLLQKN